MKITVFTSNQPRHLNLIRSLSDCCDEVFAIQECSTIFPGQVEDFYKKSDTFKTYFSKVLEAEKKVFGSQNFLPENVRQFAIRFGDLNKMPLERFGEALNTDLFIVFGSSYIKGDLIDFLVSKGCINLHMGVSPYYRGTATNFWPLHDQRPEYVGTTIHLISKGLDSGDILYHAMPKPQKYHPFEIGMQAVKASHLSLKKFIKTNEIKSFQPVKQDRSLELRYSKRLDFNDEIAAQFLQSPPSPEFINDRLKNISVDGLINPVYL